MSDLRQSETTSMVLGALTATGIGAIVFQAATAIVLGIMGALGGYLFQHVLKPKLDKVFKKKSDKEA